MIGSDRLLAANEPQPFIVENAGGASPFVLIGDHAGNRIPASLADLGVPADHLRRHIAWDIGVPALGCRLARAIDAPLIHQPYSRLVIDCNRDPARADAMPTASDGTPIEGNAAMTPGDAQRRIAEIHRPYHDRIATIIAARRGRPTALVAIHSFTPSMNGHARPWQIGILHDGGNRALVDFLFAALRERPDLCVGDNEPYRMSEVDYTIPRHAFPANLPYAEIEIRQDLIADDRGAQEKAALLEALLQRAAQRLFPGTGD